jgi:starch phosphorylase
MNGVLNLSVPDGWWAEGFNGKNGWAITAGRFYTHSELQETAEAGQIYDFLEEEIAELFYDRNDAGIPKRWVTMMKESIISVCGNFNMNRVLMDYSKKFYTPAVKTFDSLHDENYRQLKIASQQEQEIRKYWDIIGITDLATSVDKKDHIVEGDALDARCTVNLDRAPTELFCVELFYMFDNRHSYKVVPMTLKSRQGNLAYYECSFKIEGYGLHNLDVRIRPADATVQDLHPEMVKWSS